MSAADRPWWATEGDVPPGGGPDPDEDPLLAHRAARRGAPAEPPDDAPRDDVPDDDGPTHTIDACGVCPICVGLRALGDVRPELVGHLAEAARHLALAVRTVVDAAVSSDDPPGPSGPDRGGDDLQRIDLDG